MQLDSLRTLRNDLINCQKKDRTKTYYAREAIVEYLDDLEDYYLAVDRLKSPGRRWTMEEVEQELGLGN